MSFRARLYTRLVRLGFAMTRHRVTKFLRSVLRPVRNLWRRSGVLGLVDVPAQGFRFRVDTRDLYIAPWLAANGVWEPHVTALLQRLLAPGMTFVDVGANIGYHTVLASARVGPGGRVVAFEPDPHNATLLEANVALNGCANVTVERKALSDEAGTATLYLAPDNQMDHRIWDDEGRRPAGAIEKIRLDAYVGQRGLTMDVLKVDTQGVDLMVLKGAGDLLARERLVVVVEFWPEGLERQGQDPRALPALLTAHGFRLQELRADGGVAPFDVDAFLARPDRHLETDLLCTKS
jgi:FkbM family methyltransferase